jgi:putative endopeptidase
MRIILLSILAVSTVAFAKSKQTPTSDIPERREFPLNQKIKPCDDFYGYVCSEALSKFKLRDDRSKHTFSFSDSSERLLKKKEQFLSSLSRSKKVATERQQNLKTIFDACMNQKASTTDEKSIVKETLSKIAAIKTPADYNAFNEKQYSDGRSFVWDFGDIANQDKPLESDVYLLPDLMTLPERSYYDNKELIQDLKKVMGDFFRAINYSQPQKRATTLVDFERSYAQVFPLPAEFRELLTKRVYVTREDLLKKYPGIGLESFLKDVPATVKIRDFSPAAMKWFSDYVTASQDDKHKLSILKDHLVWSTVSSLLDDSNPTFFKKQFDFKRKHLGGPTKRPPRKERCTSLVMGRFGRELDAEMIDVVFPNFPSQKIINLGEKIRSAIISRMEKSDWLSAATKKEGIEKVKVMKLQLVKPANDEEWDFNLPAKYEANKPLSNLFKVNQKRREKMIHRISKPRNPNIWGMGPLTVNAYYNPTSNKFVMPIGILQYPFFDVNAPDEINLGAVGVVLGHEIGHGIDDKGSRYDKDGKIRQWMKDEEVKTFMSRGDRLVAQFDAIGHNGKLTLGENMADLSGLTFAWDAAFPGGKGNSDHKKGFYIQYGRLWCETIRPKFQEMRLKTDPHASGEARVNEQMKHQTGFAEEFGCKAGDKLWLNPKNRVMIW